MRGELGQALGKAYAVPGPLADLEVHRALAKMALAKVREGGHSLTAFLAEIKAARVSAKLEELPPEVLAKVKQAWAEAEAINNVLAARFADLPRDVAKNFDGFAQEVLEKFGKLSDEALECFGRLGPEALQKFSPLDAKTLKKLASWEPKHLEKIGMLDQASIDVVAKFSFLDPKMTLGEVANAIESIVRAIASS